MVLKYLLSKAIKKANISSIRNSVIDKTAKCEAQCLIVGSKFGRYSYCGYGCEIINTEIGNFCSISNNVIIGMSQHPLNWVSTSSAFYFGRDSISKRLANLERPIILKKTEIGNDVWIGSNVLIKGGVRIGTGAVIGMGSIVTHDIEPYSIVCGNPARLIRKRFSDDVINKLLETKWWDLSDAVLKRISSSMNDPKTFIEEVWRQK